MGHDWHASAARLKMPAARVARKRDSGASTGNLAVRAIGDVRRVLWGAVLFSAGVNILMLAGPLYMLQIYDRVLTSYSVPTLVVLTLFVVGAYVFQGMLEIIRTRILSRSACLVDDHLEKLAHDTILRLSVGVARSDAAQPVRDIDQVRAFLMSSGPIAFMDLPWVPVFLLICYAIHPLLGLVALSGAAVLVSLALLTERASRPISSAVAKGGKDRALALESRRRNAESAIAMGMVPALSARWSRTNGQYVAALQQASDVIGGFSGISKVVRLLLQSLLLGIGAFLVIRQELTPGAMIAASIMMGRALAPVEGAITQWRGFVSARQGYNRLKDMVGSPVELPRTVLPPPRQQLLVEGLTVGPPQGLSPVLRQVSFSLSAGEAVGVIGPSGAGKTSLGRALVGVWPPLAGTIRLDGATIDQWCPQDLGPHIGYLSQGIEIFDGTLAENIARLEESPDAQAVIAAARAAGAHEMILQLPLGYDTPAGEAGASLSAGQRQRVALARALFGNPSLIVLDEPNSNLDTIGEAALLRAIRDAKVRGAMVVLITHKLNLLTVCEKALLLVEGSQKAFGPRDEVLKPYRVKPAEAGEAAAASRLKTAAGGPPSGNADD